MYSPVKWTKWFLMLGLIGYLLTGTFSTVHSATQELTGVLSSSDSEGIYAIVPFSLAVDSEVELWYGADCSKQSNLSIILNTVFNDDWGKAIAYGGSTTLQPIGYYPLKKGNYLVKIRCKNENAPNDVGYSLDLSTSSISIPFSQEDSEPDPSSAVTLASTQLYDGWLGLYGYNPPQDNSNIGKDHTDSYLFNMTKGTKLKIKIEWDDFKSTDNGDDVSFLPRIYKWVDGKVYYVDAFETMYDSGQVTKEITLLESATYKIDIASYGGTTSTANKKYGGYKVTLIIDGKLPPEPEPPPEELQLTFLSAEWKTSHLGAGLVIKYKIQNTYSKSQTVEAAAALWAPMPTDLDLGSPPDVVNPDTDYIKYTYWKLTGAEVLETINDTTSSCQHDDTDWSISNIFPDGCGSMNRCQSVQIIMKGSNYTIPPHTTEERILYVIPSTEDYKRFASGYQQYSIVLGNSALVGTNKCYTGGINYWSKPAIASWILNLLLNSNSK
jgi:hypothetical protein